ncbi:MAG: hypothetical protein U1E60_06630 [Reyranellaceae bacterium]
MGDTLLTPSARRAAAHRAAHVMTPTAGPMLLNTALDMRDTARRLATMVEMVVLFVDGEIAANPVDTNVEPGLTAFEKVRAMVCQRLPLARCC